MFSLNGHRGWKHTLQTGCKCKTTVLLQYTGVLSSAALIACQAHQHMEGWEQEWEQAGTRIPWSALHEVYGKGGGWERWSTWERWPTWSQKGWTHVQSSLVFSRFNLKHKQRHDPSWKERKERRRVHGASDKNKSRKGADEIQSWDNQKKKKKSWNFLGINWEICRVFGIRRNILTIEHRRRQSEKDVLQIRHQKKQFPVSWTVLKQVKLKTNFLVYPNTPWNNHFWTLPLPLLDLRTLHYCNRRKCLLEERSTKDETVDNIGMHFRLNRSRDAEITCLQW